MYAAESYPTPDVDWRAQYHLTVQELLSERRSADALERALSKLDAEIRRAHHQLDKLGIPRLVDGRRLDLPARLHRLRRDIEAPPEPAPNTYTALVPIAHYHRDCLLCDGEGGRPIRDETGWDWQPCPHCQPAAVTPLPF